MNRNRFFLALLYYFCTNPCYCSIYPITSINDTPPEVLEHTAIWTIPEALTVQSIKNLCSLAQVNKIFYLLINEQQGKIQKKIAHNVALMWQNNDYASLIDFLEKLPSNTTFYKSICIGLQENFLDQKFFNTVMQLFDCRGTYSIHKTLSEQFSQADICKIIIIATVRSHIVSEKNIFNTSDGQKSIKKLTKKLVTLYPIHTEGLLNKMIYSFIEYIVLKESNDIRQYRQIERWLTLFAETVL